MLVEGRWWRRQRNLRCGTSNFSEFRWKVLPFCARSESVRCTTKFPIHPYGLPRKGSVQCWVGYLSSILRSIRCQPMQYRNKVVLFAVEDEKGFLSDLDIRGANRSWRKNVSSIPDLSRGTWGWMEVSSEKCLIAASSKSCWYDSVFETSITMVREPVTTSLEEMIGFDRKQWPGFVCCGFSLLDFFLFIDVVRLELQDRMGNLG
jgi:hypothetical protein